MLVETVRSRLLYRSLDAVVTAPLRPRRTLGAHLRSVLSPRSTNYDRVGSLAGIVDAIAPGTARRAGALICRRTELPFRTDRVELLAYGSGATVFVAEAGSRRRVLKIYRRSLGVSAERLQALLAEYQDKYDTIRAWYEGDAGLVWPAEFMVLPGPILGRPAVACVQEHIGDEARDFFRGFTDEELAAALNGSDELRRQFLFFAERTLHVCRSHRRCPDLLGEKNLSIVGRGGGRRLRLIDYGVFDLGDGRRAAVRERVGAYLDRIGSLAQHLGAADRIGEAGAG
ncbi:MAG: hypothetical protein ACYS15_04455 [Planctomycetota bacterium]|jgi:hypothetical protein